MANSSNKNYIYIFKCIVGSSSDVVKIGKTKHFYDDNDRMAQHGRTPYYGFIPYTDFLNGLPIATGFLVKDLEKSDKLIKNNKEFQKKQFAGLEIYNIDYDDAIKMIHSILVDHDQFLGLKSDKYSDYSSLSLKASQIIDDITDDFQDNISTGKKDFEDIIYKLLDKYSNDEFPEGLLDMLRNIKEFEENCVSHFKSKSNWIYFKDGLILDINFNNIRRKEIMKNLMKFL